MDSDQLPGANRRSRSFSWHQPLTSSAEIATLSGLEYLQKLLKSGHGAPIGDLMDFRLTEVLHGKAVFTGMPAEFHYNPIGTVHGGFAAALLDSALGCAIHSTLKPSVTYTTLELKVNFIRALLMNTGEVRCEGNVIHVGRQMGTAEARITDSQGKLYAHATSTCLIFPSPSPMSLRQAENSG